MVTVLIQEPQIHKLCLHGGTSLSSTLIELLWRLDVFRCASFCYFDKHQDGHDSLQNYWLLKTKPITVEWWKGGCLWVK